MRVAVAKSQKLSEDALTHLSLDNNEEVREAAESTLRIIKTFSSFNVSNGNGINEAKKRMKALEDEKELVRFVFG